MDNNLMTLKILLPHQVFAHKMMVKRIVTETQKGSFGILPNRLDCTAVLTPGILTYETVVDGQVHIAIDEGILVKVGKDVLIAVHNAVAGDNLGTLHQAVCQNFLQLTEQEREMRKWMAKLEMSFIKKIDEFKNK